MTGSLVLRVAAHGGKSVVTGQRHSGALRLLRPLYLDASGQVAVTVVNPGGGILGGDRYALEASVEAGADLLLTTQSATKVYRTPEDHAESVQRFTLGAEARLESVPDSVIPYAGARFRQSTEVRMDPTASLAIAEITTPGWSPDGTAYAFDELTLTTRVRFTEGASDAGAGRLVLHDRLRFLPAIDAPAARLLTQGFSHLATLVLIDPRCDAAAITALRGAVGALEPPSGDTLVGATALAVPGVVVRALTRSTPAAQRILLSALDWARQHWRGQGRLDLRKP